MLLVSSAGIVDSGKHRMNATALVVEEAAGVVGRTEGSLAVGVGSGLIAARLVGCLAVETKPLWTGSP